MSVKEDVIFDHLSYNFITIYKHFITDLEMSLIESCAALGIEISHSASLDEIIEILQSRSDDLKVKLLLGIALQEAERDTEAYKDIVHTVYESVCN